MLISLQLDVQHHLFIHKLLKMTSIYALIFLKKHRLSKIISVFSLFFNFFSKAKKKKS